MGFGEPHEFVSQNEPFRAASSEYLLRQMAASPGGLAE
jgi:hypothetical protein